MNVESRFWPKVMRALDWDSCWPWTGAKKGSDPQHAYGNFKLRNGITMQAPRVSFTLFNNRSPGQLFVLHRCDNPVCVNPTHLFLGTNQDNMTDMMSKGRHRTGPTKGEQNGAAKLNAAQVETIRDLIRAKLTNVAIAARFGVTHQLISRIRRGRSWGEPAMQPKYASLKRTPLPQHS